MAAAGRRPGRSDTWAGISGAHQTYPDPALLACYTPVLLAAAAEIAGDPVETITPPDGPTRSTSSPGPAPSGSGPTRTSTTRSAQHGHHVFPRAFRVAGMTFLNDVPPHGAGTVLWPGSHRKLADLARSDPERYEMMWALNKDLDRVDLGEPVELTPRCGDVLLYHYLCAHAGSSNTSSQPRLALNMKW